MRDRLSGLLEKADLAIGSCSNVLGPEDLEPLIVSIRAVRTRLAYPEDILVVALAGGTGSGKSSLFNAWAGAELVDSGGVRPTTSVPAAAVPLHSAGALEGYLDRIGVHERFLVDRSGVCLIDLPDTDSVELGHRLDVDALLPVVDVVVWVIDPEKYRDARLHHEYVAPLADYSPQFVFALNQVDRLSAAQLEEVRADLATSLDEDGVEDATIVATAAAPTAGPPLGVDELGAALETRRASGSVLFGKLLTDVARVSEEIEAMIGPNVDFDARASVAVESTTDSICQDDIAAATVHLVGFVEELADETGRVTGERLGRLAGDVPAHLGRIAGQVARPRPRRRLGRRRDLPSPDPAQVSHLLNEAIVRPARALLAKRALALAALAELAVEVESLRSASRR